MTDPTTLSRRLLLRAHNHDGLPELAVGLTFLITSGLIYAQGALPKGTPGYDAAVLAFSFGLPVFILGARPFVNWIRARCFLERYGYVRHLPVPGKLRQLVLRGLIVLAATAVMALFLPPPGNWLVVVTGIGCGLLTALSGRSPRFVVGGVAAAVAGICLAWSGMSFSTAMAALFAIQGAGGVFSGSVTLWRFLSE